MVYIVSGVIFVILTVIFFSLIAGVWFGAFTLADGDVKEGITIIIACLLGLSLYVAGGLWAVDDDISDRTGHCGPGTEYRETSESWWCQAY